MYNDRHKGMRSQTRWRKRRWWVFSGVFFSAVLLLLQITYATTDAAEQGWFARTNSQVAAVWSVLQETSARVLAGRPLQVAQLGNAPPLDDEPVVTELSTIAGTPLPANGSLLINTPLTIDDPLTVYGTTRLASTTVVGGVTADAAQLESLQVSGPATLAALSVAGDLQTATLQVTNNTSLGTVEVRDTLRTQVLEVLTTLDVQEEIRAYGGLITEGADVDLGEGELFAANVVNEVRAGDNVRITGSQNEPIISFEPEPFRGVEEINGEDGDVEITEGPDIDIDDLEISNRSTLGSVRARGGCSGCITDSDVRNDLTIAGGIINNTIIGSSTRASAYFSDVTIGTSTSSTTLAVSGAATVSDVLAVSGAATSTFAGSINITDSNNCFAINGTCISAGEPATYTGLTDTPGTLLAGALQYASSSGSELVQSSNFVFDGTNLGIGTSSPQAELTVVGDMYATGALLDSTASSGVAGAFLQSTGTSTEWITLSEAGLGDGTYLGLSDTPNSFTAQAVQYANAAGDAIVQADTFVFDGANLAVGTTTPSTRLTVDGDVSVLGQQAARWYEASNNEYVGFRASSSLSTSTIWTLPASDGTHNQLLVTNGAGDLTFKDVSAIGGGANTYLELLDTPSSYQDGAVVFASSSALTQSSDFVYQNGFLGLGVASPADRLSVDGSVTFAGAGSRAGFVYDRSNDRVGVGTDDPTSKFTVEGGSILQRGGTASEQYTPTLLGGVALSENTNDVVVQLPYAYAVTDGTGNNFYTIDVTDVHTPEVVGATSLVTDVRGLDVQGDYAYGVSTVSGDDFHVIDISDPHSPAEVSSLNLPTSANDVTVRGQYAYVGTASSDDGFHVIDISDPLQPVALDSITLDDAVNKIVIQGDYAYAVTETQNNDLHVIDISDPTNVSEVGALGFPSSVRSIFVRNAYAYVVTSGARFYTVDISDPASLSTIGSTDLTTGANDVSVAGNYAYVTTQSNNDDFHVIDIQDPTAPVEVGSVDPGAGNALSVRVAGRYAYITTGSSGDSFHVIDISGAELQSALVHSLQSDTLAVSGGANVSGRMTIGLGARVGYEGIYTDGALAISGTSSSYIRGNLGIGTTTPTEKLTVTGTIRSTDLLGGATNLTTDASGNIIRDPSDARLKQNVTDIEGALDTVLSLRGVTYEWINKDRFGTQREVGFIAQEVETVLPEVVRQGGEYWSLNTRNIVAVVVEAIKDLWAELQGTQEEVAELQERVEYIKTLENRVETLEQQVQGAPATPDTDDDSDASDSSNDDEEELDDSTSNAPEPASTTSRHASTSDSDAANSSQSGTTTAVTSDTASTSLDGTDDGSSTTTDQGNNGSENQTIEPPQDDETVESGTASSSPDAPEDQSETDALEEEPDEESAPADIQVESETDAATTTVEG